MLRFLNVRPTQQHRRRHARRHQRDAVIPETLESAGQQALRHGFPRQQVNGVFILRHQSAIAGDAGARLLIDAFRRA
ncbi:Uncharacterised protein [Klebsiella pneumoniae]|nr:Uncharacterised protein [Klebsiella pneumoniae]